VNDVLRACHNLIILDEGLNVSGLHISQWMSTWKTNCPRSILIAPTQKFVSRSCALPALRSIMSQPSEHVKATTTIVTSCCTLQYFGRGTLHVLKA